MIDKNLEEECMLFYKIEGSLVKTDAENEDSRKAKEIISLNFEFFEKIAAALAKKRLLSAVDIQKIKSECKIVPVAL